MGDVLPEVDGIELVAGGGGRPVAGTPLPAAHARWGRREVHRAVTEVVEDRGQTACLLLVGIDDLPAVRRALGHQVGETLLADVLLRLGMELPADARVEPVSEDEIAVLVPSVDRLDAAVELGARLGRATSGPYHVGGREVYIATRAGAATSAEVPEPEDLVSAASEALSRAGTGPAGPVVVYREEFSAETFGRISLTGALHRAVERGDLRLVYQPSVELATGRIAGVEALARWDHPELGTISPATFIPIAERTGLIEPIGAWVREEACRQYVAWSERFDVSDLRVSVNVSARELEQPGLAERFAATLAATGAPAANVVVELTESALVHDPEVATSTLERFAELGLDVWVDDFGVGYSSLARLREYAVTTLKLDRSFVAGLGDGPDDRRIVEAVVTMAHGLGSRVVAEGVETRRQLVELRDMGVEYGQGFYWAEPLAPAAVEAWIDGRATPLGHHSRRAATPLWGR